MKMYSITLTFPVASLDIIRNRCANYMYRNHKTGTKYKKAP